MMHFFLLGFLFLYHLHLEGGVDEDMDEARSYVESGDFNQGREIYERLLKTTKETWKKNILQYNLATTALEEKEYDNAIAGYKTMVMEEKLPPLISTRVHTNLAIAYWRSIENSKLNTENIDVLTGSYLSIIFNLEKTLDEIILAEAAHCDLILAEGGEYCKRDENLFLLQSSVQNKMTDIKIEFLNRQIEMLSLNESLPLALIFTNMLGSYLEEISVDTSQTTVFKEQVNRMEVQMNTWNALWEHLDNQNKNNKNYTSFEKEYDKLLNSLKKFEIDKAILQLSTIKQKLKENIKQIYKDIPTEKLFKDLTRNYKRVAATLSLNPEEILSLIEQQAMIQDVLKQRDISITLLEEAQNFLKLSVKNWQKQNLDLSKVYFLIAYKKTLRNSYDSIAMDPQFVTVENVALFLEHLIEEQKINAALSLFTGKSKENEISSESNKETIDFAKNFWKLVPIVQKLNFSTQCQFYPWSEVIPLFESGFYYAMELAYDRSLIDWKKSLEKLLHPSDIKSFCQPNPPSKKNEPEKEENNPQKKNSSAWSSGSIDDVLRLLQTMDQQDRQNKNKIRPDGILKERLW